MGLSRNRRGRFTSSQPVTVDNESKIQDAMALIQLGPVTFILVYADWCGYCQKYKPLWKMLEKTPGRTANIVSIRDDMLPKITGVSGAKIQGYPSVIKVTPTGKISEYKVPGTEEITNAMPIMRDIAEMKKELTQAPPADRQRADRHQRADRQRADRHRSAHRQRAHRQHAHHPPPDSKIPGLQSGVLMSGGFLAESVLGSLFGAVKQAGPAALLLLGHSMLPNKRKTFKSPKRSSHRASTRRNRSSVG